MDMHLERLLRQHKQLDKASTRILEINPGHPLIKALAVRAQQSGAVDALEDAAHLLLDQAPAWSRANRQPMRCSLPSGWPS